MKQNEQYEA